MDRELFSKQSPGKLIKVDAPHDYAFLPHPLPPDWTFPADLWPLLADAREQLALLNGLVRNLPNPRILLRPLTDREAIQSSRIEGTYTTPQDLLLFEIEAEKPNSQEDRSGARNEVSNYSRALQLGMESSLPLSLRLIRELHRELMSGVRGGDRTPGKFRTVQVAIGVNRRFMPPPPTEIGALLDQLEKYVHTRNSPYHALVDSFLVHYQFETIHPFQDGNGRVGRLLLSLMIQRKLGMSRPWLYLSDYFDRHRDEYMRGLFRVSTDGDWTGWIRFCLEAAAHQALDTVQRCERLLSLKQSLSERVAKIKGSTRLATIVEQVFDTPFLNITDQAKRLGVTYLTAQRDLERLEAAGLLRELPNHSPRTYYAPEIYAIAYEDLGAVDE